MGSALVSEFEHKKQSIEENATLPNFNQDLLVRLKGLASDPCNMESSQYSIHKLRQEMLKIRKSFMLMSEKYPKMKRDLNQFLNDGNSSFPFGLSREKSTYQNSMKKRRFQSSFSCTPYSKGKGDSFQGKEGNIAFSSFIDRENCIFSKQYISLLDSIESTKESNQVIKQEHLVVSSDDYTQSAKKPVQEKPNIELLEILKSLVIFKGQTKTFHASRANKEDKKKLKPAQTFSLSRGGNHSLTRPVIPIGPRFQAEIPKWEGPTMKRHHDSGDDSRFPNLANGI